MAFTRAWDESQPADSDRVYSGASEIRNLKADMRERVNNRCPIGGITEWPSETVPDMWLECNGASVLRSSYQSLLAAIGFSFGIPADSTHFYLPDLRGIFVRGFPNGVANSPDPDTGSTVITATTTSGSPTLTVVSSLELLQVGASLSGTGIPAGATISSFSLTANTITMSANATATGTLVSITVSISTFTATTVDGSATLTPTSTLAFPRVGASITGDGIPLGTKIIAVNVTGDSITMSNNATEDATGVTITINNNIIGTSTWDQIRRHCHTVQKTSYVRWYDDAYHQGGGWTHTLTTLTNSGGTETRPNNTSVMYIIRATDL